MVRIEHSGSLFPVTWLRFGSHWCFRFSESQKCLPSRPWLRLFMWRHPSQATYVLTMVISAWWHSWLSVLSSVTRSIPKGWGPLPSCGDLILSHVHVLLRHSKPRSLHNCKWPLANLFSQGRIFMVFSKWRHIAPWFKKQASKAKGFSRFLSCKKKKI